MIKLFTQNNGSLSAEHGIGRSKAKYLKLANNSTKVLYMQKIKVLFDPNNILNPGKVFPLKNNFFSI